MCYLCGGQRTISEDQFSSLFPCGFLELNLGPWISIKCLYPLGHLNGPILSNIMNFIGS